MLDDRTCNVASGICQYACSVSVVLTDSPIQSHWIQKAIMSGDVDLVGRTDKHIVLTSQLSF